MDIEPLLRRYARLKQELTVAYGARPWQSKRIDRLADDLVAMECQLAQLQPDERRLNRVLGRGAL